MKILIVGEYSGFAKNLAEGFKDLGHECVIISYGDGWKNIDTGGNGYLLKRPKNWKLGNLELRGTWRIKGCFLFKQIVFMKEKYEHYFDAVLVINYEFLRLNYEKWYTYFSFKDLKQMLTPEGKIYLSSCGDDYPTLLYTKKLRYTAYVNVEKSVYFTNRSLRVFRKVCRNIVGVIPVMCGYSDGYRDVAEQYGLKVFNVIPLPIDLKTIIPMNKIEDKIVIFHGLNRAIKGTTLIVEALNRIKVDFSDKVEVIVKERMPLKQYLSLMQRTNIIVDQCWSYAYGMNAIYGMAMGKVVLSGNEEECGKEFKRNDVPVINILPDIEDIYQKLKELICQPEKIISIGKQSAKFVEEFHNAQVVAKSYIQLMLTQK